MKELVLKAELYRPSIVRSALALSLIATPCTLHAHAQQDKPDTTEVSSSNSYGLLETFHTVATALPPSPAPQTATDHHVETSVSLGGFAQFTATRLTTPSNTFTTESINPSAGVLGTVRQSFRPWLGYSINMGFTRASEHYSVNATGATTNNTNNASILANMYEYSLSYVAEKHLTPRLSGFADIGGGMVVFQPTQANAGSVPTAPFTNYRPEGVGGIGIDYSLGHRLGLRAEYRGQLYKFADYGARFARNYTVTSEPTVSVTYSFGKGSASKH